MRLIIGLGNPGIEYQFTRHNLGFLVVERLAEAARARVEQRKGRCLLAHAELEGQSVVLAKPLTYVNVSGLAVRELLQVLELTPEALVVVSDELALPEGGLRIRPHGSAGGHHGLESIIGALGTQGFVRLRLGIGPEHPVDDASDFVLRTYRRSELKRVDEQVERAAEAVRLILREGLQKAMNRFNRRSPKQAAEKQGE